MNKKGLLSILLAVTLLLGLGAPALADEPIPVQGEDVTGSMKGSIVILHSNDVHGAIDGYAKMAGLKEMYTLLGADVLVLDAGDFIQGETAVSESQGSTAVELMDLVGYDAAAPGNHEFDYGYDNLKKLEAEADFPLLAANVTKDGANAFGDHVVLETSAGKKVGVFGLTTPETASKAHPAQIAGVKFAGGEELYKTAQGEVDALKAEGADYIVCLGHLGIDEETAATANRSIDLLEKVSGIDVFIDGHSHSTLDDVAAKVGPDWKVGDAVLTSTGTKFAAIGAVEISPEGEITPQSYAIENVGNIDAEIAAEAEKLHGEIEAVYGATFARSEVALDGNKAPGVRTGETNLGDLIADAMLWRATREGGLAVPEANVVAIANGGGIRASIDAGDVTRNDIKTVLPFGNTVAVVYVPGSALLEVLEASTYCAPEPVGAFPQVAGISLTVDATVAYAQGEPYGDTTYFAPASIGRVTVNSVNGEPFDESATYAVVTNDFLAAGGDTYYALTQSQTIVDTGIPLDEAVMDYITEVLGGVIGQDYAAPQGRLSVVTKPPMWYDAAVATVTEKGLMTGTLNGFEPDATVTRATVFQTLYNMEGKPAPDTGVAAFPDAQGKWYDSAARWARQAGLTNGTGAGYFDGEREVLRSEIVAVIYRYAQYKGADLSIGSEVNLLTDYVDAELLTAWSLPAFQWCVGAKVVAGKTAEAGAILAPGHTATRAELAQILINLSDFFLPAAQ